MRIACALPPPPPSRKTRWFYVSQPMSMMFLAFAKCVSESFSMQKKNVRNCSLMKCLATGILTPRPLQRTHPQRKLTSPMHARHLHTGTAMKSNELRTGRQLFEECGEQKNCF